MLWSKLKQRFIFAKLIQTKNHRQTICYGQHACTLWPTYRRIMGTETADMPVLYERRHSSCRQWVVKMNTACLLPRFCRYSLLCSYPPMEGWPLARLSWLLKINKICVQLSVKTLCVACCLGTRKEGKYHSSNAQGGGGQNQPNAWALGRESHA